MYYNKQVPEIYDEFRTSPSGLTEEQVKENRIAHGENKLYEKKKKGVLQVFLEQFKDLLVIILIIAALISLSTGNLESTIVIISVLILNPSACNLHCTASANRSD